jgi:hypothetical protein
MNDLTSSASGQRKSGVRVVLTVARVADHMDVTSTALPISAKKNVFLF